MDFDVAQMGKRQSSYDKAVQQQVRRQAEKTLCCSECGTQNKPGAVVIDIDEYDDARCPCGHVFQVRIA